MLYWRDGWHWDVMPEEDRDPGPDDEDGAPWDCDRDLPLDVDEEGDDE